MMTNGTDCKEDCSGLQERQLAIMMEKGKKLKRLFVKRIIIREDVRKSGERIKAEVGISPNSNYENNCEI